jgi:hypothetical protein
MVYPTTVGVAVTSYRVVAQHDGEAWSVRIEDPDGKLIGGTRASTVDQIDKRARNVVAGTIGARPDDVALAVRIQLDPALQYRLDALEGLRREADQQIRLAEHELADAGLSVTDIAALLSDAVTNQEIAAHGLRRHPQAVAVRFDDRGRFATVTCRACLEKDRASYADLPPEGINTLLFGGPLMCDVCFEDIPTRD